MPQETCEKAYLSQKLAKRIRWDAIEAKMLLIILWS